MTSKDNQAWILPVGLPGDLGSTQSSRRTPASLTSSNTRSQARH